MVSISREKFNAAVAKALEIAAYHGKESLSGDNPRFFAGITISEEEKRIIQDAYRDVSSGGDTSARRKKYEKLLLDYLEKTTKIENRGAFESGAADTLELPDIRISRKEAADIFFCGPFGMGDYGFYLQLKTQLRDDPSLKARLNNAVVSSTALAQQVLSENLSDDEQTAMLQLSRDVTSTYFRADQSAIANGVMKMFEGLNVNRVHTERFVHPQWDGRSIRSRLGTNAIIIATIPNSAEVVDKVVTQERLPLGQVRDSVINFKRNLPLLANEAEQFCIYNYDGENYSREHNWRGPSRDGGADR